jgi:hypothetical protein
VAAGEASECDAALRAVTAAMGALTACAARQGAPFHVVTFFQSLFTACCRVPDLPLAAGSQQQGAESLRERAHAASHACLLPLLEVLGSGCAKASIGAADCLEAMLELRGGSVFVGGRERVRRLRGGDGQLHPRRVDARCVHRLRRGEVFDSGLGKSCELLGLLCWQVLSGWRV